MNHRSWFALVLLLLPAASALAGMSILTGGGDANARYNAVGSDGGGRYYYAVGAHADSSANWQGWDSLVGEVGFLPGATSSEAFGAVYSPYPSQGTVVGACNNYGDNWQAFQCTTQMLGWVTPQITMTALPMPTGAQGSAAYGISNDGKVIVGAAGASDLSSVQPVKWTSGGTVASMLPLLPNTVEGQAVAASGYGGFIVGNLYDSSYNSVATVWSTSCGVEQLHTPTGAISTQANDISTDSWWVVGSCFDGNMYKAVRWDGQWDPTVLPALPGSLGMVATACSADGAYVVGYAIENGADEAFIWDAFNGTRSMSSFLSGEMHDAIDGFTFEHANDVLVEGKTIVIVGDGTYFGNVGWMAVETLPEPTSLALLGLGGLVLRRRRR